jgi:hypothetical protein
MKTSEHCAFEFVTSRNEETATCRDCWRKIHEYDTLAKQVRELSDYATYLEKELYDARKSRRIAFSRSNVTARIPPAMLRALISLCHPDKHGGRDIANKATAWLLAQRQAGP